MSFVAEEMIAARAVKNMPVLIIRKTNLTTLGEQEDLMIIRKRKTEKDY